MVKGDKLSKCDRKFESLLSIILLQTLDSHYCEQLLYPSIRRLDRNHLQLVKL